MGVEPFELSAADTDSQTRLRPVDRDETHRRCHRTIRANMRPTPRKATPPSGEDIANGM